MRKIIARILLLVLFFTGISFSYGQNRRLDSLVNLNNQHRPQDSLKAILLGEVARAYLQSGDIRKTELYIDSAILVASRLPTKYALAKVYQRVGSMFHSTDRLRAQESYNKSIEVAQSIGYKRLVAGNYLNLGALYMNLKDYPKSLEAHEQSIKNFNDIGDTTNIVSCYMNMSYIYNAMGQKLKGLEYIRKSLRAFETGDSDRGVAVACQEMAFLFFDATDKELVEMGIRPENRVRELTVILEKGLARSLKTDDISLTSGFYIAFGRLNQLKGDYTAARKYYQQGIDLLKDTPEEESYGDNLVVTADFWSTILKDHATASSMLHMALDAARKYDAPATEEDALNALSSLQEKTGRYDSALFYYRQAIVIKDSTFSREKEQEITRRQLKIDFDIKEKDYRNAQQLAEARLASQQKEILLRKQQLEIIDKEKTLERLTFLQQQAELQKQKEEQANLLERKKLEADYQAEISAQQLNLKNAELDSNRWLSVFLALVAVVVIIAALLIYRSRKKTMRLNEIVSQQKTSLEELVDVKDKIFSVVSHDLRGPINNIMALGSILDEEEVEQETLKLYVAQMKGTLSHTSWLMENLINWSASQMRGFKPEINDVDISTLARQALAIFAEPLRNKKLELVQNITPGVVVRGDRNMIELIIRNLVSNAIKFSRSGDKLELATFREADQVVFSVKDNGIGMGESKVANINSPAILSVESTQGTQKEKGTGLGLMLCKHFATLMGGNITVKSEQGAGSHFHVSLPSAG